MIHQCYTEFICRTKDRVPTGTAKPILAQVLSDPFRAYAAKKFPGMIESSALMRHFSKQGLKLVIRKDVKYRGRNNGDHDVEDDEGE
jgi:hypothetical protein